MSPGMAVLLLWAVIGSVAAELEWKFTKFPEPVTAPVGDNVTFECAVNVPGEELAWRWRLERPGEPWTNAKGETDREKISTRLVVKIEREENVLYQCVVWYGAISLASDPARLTIARIDLSRNTGETRVITAPLHNTIVLHCKEPISEPPAELSWWKEVSPGKRQQIDTAHGVLVIHNATATDSGTYGCTAANELSGQVIDLPEKTYLKVQHEGIGGIRFLESEDYVGETTDKGLTVPVRPNGALRLWCGAVGTPPPRVTWYRGDELRNGFRHDHDLVVHPFTAEDEGIYSCSVNGNAIRRSWRVLALQPPYWEGVASGVNASEGAPARVACGTPIGQPPPNVNWMLNAEAVPGKGVKATGSELRFPHVEKRHAGAVQCFACNALGCAHDSALLTVVPVQVSDQEYAGESTKAAHIYQSSKRNNNNNRKNQKKNKKMVPPSKPTVTRMSDESVMVSWSNSSSGMPIQIFKVQYREVKNSSNGQWHTANSDIPPYIHSYEVDGLIPDRWYKFRIAAVYMNQDNLQGRSSNRYYLQRGGIEGPRAPDLVSVEPDSSTSVRLNWTWSSGGGVEAEGFYVYYRAVSSAGKYEKATIEGGARRSAVLGHLAPDTAYEWKLQSYTAQAPSEFSRIRVAKTLRSATAPGTTTEPPPEEPKRRAPAALVTAGGAIGATALLAILVVTLLLCRRARRPPANKEKGSAETGANGYIPAKVPITITANPMHAESGDGGVEMSFLHNNNCGNAADTETLPRTRKNGPSRQYV